MATLPFRNTTIPNSSKPRTFKTNTIITCEDTTELDVELYAYLDDGAPPDDTMTCVIASFAHNGSQAAVANADSVQFVPQGDMPGMYSCFVDVICDH